MASNNTDTKVGAGVGAVIIRNGAILLNQRTGSHGAGLWSVPGGWIDKGETATQAAEREAREETGLIVRALGPWGPGWTSGTFDQVGAYSVTLWVECAYLGGEPIVAEPHKCLDVRWVPVDEVDMLPLFWPMTQILNDLKRLDLRSTK